MDGLQRFVDAQAGVIEDVCAELRAGCKQSHWMWFIFPQLRGLGHSAMAQHYGIASRAEALAYWQHPLLGPRLRQCMQLLLGHADLSAQDMLGSIDALKLHSCATLFAAVAPQEPVFGEVLQRFYGGMADERTLALMAS
jgi:uncharacterized protein (DUF1810 family)